MTTHHITLEDEEMNAILAFLTQAVEDRIDQVKSGLVDEVDLPDLVSEVHLAWTCMIALQPLNTALHRQIDQVRDAYFPKS